METDGHFEILGGSWSSKILLGMVIFYYHVWVWSFLSPLGPGRWRCCSTRFSEPWGQDPMIPFRWPKASKMFLRIPVTGQGGAADLFLDTFGGHRYIEARAGPNSDSALVSGWGKMWTIQCWLSCNGTCGWEMYSHLLGTLTGSHSLPKHVWSNDQIALFQHSMFGSRKREILSMKVSHSWRYAPDCIWNGWLIGMTIEAIATVWQRWLYSYSIVISLIKLRNAFCVHGHKYVYVYMYIHT